jgi:nucleotide-binding universal stress UspA family protein
MRLDDKRILVPVNGGEVSEHTFRWACRTARESKSELHAVYVIEVPLELPLEAEITADINRGEDILARIETIASEEKCKNMHARFLRARDPGPAIVMEAEDRHVDLIILGIPYKRRLGSWDMGSTAEYIFHNAACQMILWRQSAPSLVLLRD